MNDGLSQGIDNLEQLVREALEGRRPAREKFVQLCERPIRRGVSSVFKDSRPPEDVEDAVYRAFVDLLEALPHLQKHISLFNFARTIGRHAALKFLNEHKEERAKRVDVFEPNNVVTTMPAPDANAEETLRRHELKTRLYALLVPKLTPRDAQLFKLFFIQEFTIQETADHLGLKRNHVYQILFKLRQRLYILARILDPE